MSREIKFRCWDKQAKSMHHIETLDFSPVHGGLLHIRVDGNEELLTDGFILMQYTGLKDSKGVEIYEGDICKYYDEVPVDKEAWDALSSDNYYSGGWKDREYIGKVEYDNEVVGFTVGGTKWFDSKIEVIGNIYENPELLKGQDE